MINNKDYFRIGVITEPHGIKGEVKIFPTTDDPARIKKLKEIIMDNGKEEMILHPVSMKIQKQFVIVKFSEFNDRNDVERLRKNELYVTRENAVKLNEDEYYIADLIGLKVIEDEAEIGVIADVFETGANDVYEIDRINGEKLYLPAIKECILEVNIADGYVKVHVMPGL